MIKIHEMKTFAEIAVCGHPRTEYDDTGRRVVGRTWTDGEVRAYADSAEPNMRGFHFNPPAPIEVDVELDNRLARDTAPWVKASVETLGRSSVWYRRVAAVGELLRFDAEPAPAVCDTQFARSLNESLLDEVERVVAILLGDLFEQISMLSSLLGDHDLALFEARSIVEKRELVESLIVVLAAAGRFEVTAKALDMYASTWATTFDWIDDARLRGERGDAVRAARPNSWWVENRRSIIDVARLVG